MSKQALPCVVCGRELENIFEDVENQPSGGTSFSSSGHYGSTAFDSMTARVQLELNFCDPCLTSLRERGRIAIVAETTKRTFEYKIWNGDEFE